MRCQLAREIRFRSIGTEDIRQPEKKPPRMCHGLRLIQQKFVHEAREPAPALGLLLERSHTGPGDGVVLGVAIVFGLLPRAVDPPLLFESHEGGVQGALIQRQRMIGDLFEACGEGVGVLRSHAGERAQHDEIERSLEEFDARAPCARHPSGPADTLARAH